MNGTKRSCLLADAAAPKGLYGGRDRFLEEARISGDAGGEGVPLDRPLSTLPRGPNGTGLMVMGLAGAGETLAQRFESADKQWAGSDSFERWLDRLLSGHT